MPKYKKNMHWMSLTGNANKHWSGLDKWPSRGWGNNEGILHHLTLTHPMDDRKPRASVSITKEPSSEARMMDNPCVQIYLSMLAWPWFYVTWTLLRFQCALQKGAKRGWSNANITWDQSPSGIISARRYRIEITGQRRCRIQREIRPPIF